MQDGDFRGFYSKILTYIYTNLKQIPGDGRKSGGASAPPAPPSLAPMEILLNISSIVFLDRHHVNIFSMTD